MIKQNETVTIKRSQVSFASYNPRKITSESKRKLEKNLQKFGLMGGIVWNERTGNLVSGHQRVSILDKQNGYKPDKPETDYDLLVTKVNLSDEEEKSQNIFFNNTLAQGYFDDDKLKSLMDEVKFSEYTGFNKQEQISCFAQTDLTDEEYQKIAEKVQAATDKITKMQDKSKVETDSNYVVLVFKNRHDKEMLINNLDIILDNDRFINGQDFLSVLYEKWEEMQG